MKVVLVFVLLFCNFICVSQQEIVWDKNKPFTSANIYLATKKLPATIVLNHSFTIEHVVEVPENISLVFKEGGTLKIAAEDSRLIIHGNIIAPKQNIFDISATGVTSYRFESVSNIQLTTVQTFYPEWWGIFPNVIPGQNGDTRTKTRHHYFMKEMMLDIASSGGGNLIFSKGVYYTRDIVVDFSDITITGQGKETILRFDRENFGYSTRRGGIFTIQGPTLEKYYIEKFPNGVSIAGNFLFDKKQKTIDNILIKDFVIEWNEISAKEDPSMNGLTIVNATNVTVDNVHVNLFGANRAFYIGSIFEGDVTKNINIKNSSCEQSRTGVFILHGYKNDVLDRKKLEIGNVTIENNVFDVVEIPELDIKNTHIIPKYLDTYSSGIYFIGNEYTQSFQNGEKQYEREIGTFLIKNNIIKNADFGIRSWTHHKDKERELTHDIVIEENTFLDFNYIGVFAPFTKSIIRNNIFKVSTLNKLPISLAEKDEELYAACAIQIAKGPYKRFKSLQGPENILIENNRIEGCFDQVSPLVVQPNEGAQITLNNNTFIYNNNCIAPINDIVVTTSRKKYKTKRATIIVNNNQKINNQLEFTASIYKDNRRKKLITIISN